MIVFDFLLFIGLYFIITNFLENHNQSSKDLHEIKNIIAERENSERIKNFTPMRDEFVNKMTGKQQEEYWNRYSEFLIWKQENPS